LSIERLCAGLYSAADLHNKTHDIHVSPIPVYAKTAVTLKGACLFEWTAIPHDKSTGIGSVLP
jgi:hypothetical protein